MSDFVWTWTWNVVPSGTIWTDYVIAIGTATTAVTAIFAVWFAWRSIIKQAQNSRVEKIADTLMECDRRYSHVRERILQTEESLASEFWCERNVEKLSSHYERAFWALQFEQWQYFRLGLVPQESFSMWIAARVREFRSETDTIFGKKYTESWKANKLSFGNMEDFQDFLDRVSEMSNDSEEIKEFIQEQAESALEFYQTFKKDLQRFGNSESVQREARKRLKAHQNSSLPPPDATSTEGGE